VKITGVWTLELVIDLMHSNLYKSSSYIFFSFFFFGLLVWKAATLYDNVLHQHWNTIKRSLVEEYSCTSEKVICCESAEREADW